MPVSQGELAAGIQRALFGLARSRLAGWLLKVVFAKMSFTVPVQRLRETPALIAFYHPSPGYPFHVLIVPKRSYRSLVDLDPGDMAFQHDLFTTITSLVNEFGLESRGYRLVANGGRNQDVPILHFHLISEKP